METAKQRKGKQEKETQGGMRGIYRRREKSKAKQQGWGISRVYPKGSSGQAQSNAILRPEGE
jgi:hypothetical protein